MKTIKLSLKTPIAVLITLSIAAAFWLGFPLMTGVTLASAASGSAEVLGENLFTIGTFEDLLNQNNDEIVLGDPATYFDGVHIGTLPVDSPARIRWNEAEQNTYLTLSFDGTRNWSMFFATWTGFGQVPRGHYRVTMDLRYHGVTGNHGFRFAPNGPVVYLVGGGGPAADVERTPLENGWVRTTFIRYLPAGGSINSISSWMDTMGGNANVEFDNIQVQSVTWLDNAVFANDEASFYLNDPADVIFTVDMQDSTELVDVKHDGTALTDNQFDFDEATGQFTLDSAFLAGLVQGRHTLEFVTDLGTVDFFITVGNRFFNQAPLVITGVPATLVFGVTNATITLGTTGGSGDGAVTFSVTGSATVSGNTLAVTGAGTITVTATKAAHGFYRAVTATAAITVTQGAQSALVVTAPATFEFSAANNVITLGTTGGTTDGAVIFAVVSGPATVSGNTLTVTDAGIVVVTATMAGNDNFEAVTSAQFSITVTAAEAMDDNGGCGSASVAAMLSIFGVLAIGSVAFVKKR